MNVVSASNPAYADPANRTVRLSVLFADANAPVSYVTADGDAPSQALFDAAVAGTYGAVAAFANASAPTAAPALRAYANIKLERLRAAARAYTLDGGLVVYADATQGTWADLIGLKTWGEAYPAASTNFVQNDGGVVPITAAQAVTLAAGVLVYGQRGFAVLALAMNGVANGSITSTAAIDALAWPV